MMHTQPSPLCAGTSMHVHMRWRGMVWCGMAAAPSACGTCAGAALATIVNGTMLPSVYSTRTANLAFDQTLYALGSNLGAWATGANTNSMQFALSAPTDSVSAIYLYAGATSQTSSSGFLSVYLSRTTNYSDPATSVTCARGAAVIAGRMGAVTCSKLTSANFVRRLVLPVAPWDLQARHADQACGCTAATGMVACRTQHALPACLVRVTGAKNRCCVWPCVSPPVADARCACR